MCGERVQLYAERALYWPSERALFVADVHLGKSAAFRAGGVPVPRGTTADDLQRLAKLLERTRAEKLFVLGDFLHASSGRVSALDAAFTAWRIAHHDVAMTLVRGNHDRHAGDPPSAWDIRVVTEPWVAAPFLLCHTPATPPTGHALCGHIHPATWVSGIGFESARLPCFVLAPRLTILPAFGRFTGLAVVPSKPGQEIVAIAGPRLFPVPTPNA